MIDMGKVKICLDAGHYGKYNRSAAVPAYYESDMNWKLHLKLKAALEEYGIEVITTRANQATDRGLSDRGRAAAGCNLFLSIHSNATGGSVDEATDYPLVIVPIDGSGDAIGKQLAKCIEETMCTKQKGRIYEKRSDKGYDWYGVIRGAVSVGVPGLILEHSFHTNTRSTNWLLDDANLDKLAKAEAAVIAAYYGLVKPTKTETRYRVVVADSVYDNKTKADESVAKLSQMGFKATIEEEIIIVEVPVEPAPITPAPATPSKKSVEEIAKEVYAGNWGNGQERKDRLAAAGYDYAEIQKLVNKLANGENITAQPKKSITEIAQEVIAGVWGNGQDRKNRIVAAGYDYSAVQKKVNELLK
jgi:N-acetylmuramoyl-L-alanine amidase